MGEFWSHAEDQRSSRSRSLASLLLCAYGRRWRHWWRGLCASDQHGAYPARDPVTPGDIAATIYWRFGIDHQTIIYDHLTARIAWPLANRSNSYLPDQTRQCS